MKPVDQTTFGHPGGNCFSACIASLLDLPIADVPYFMDVEDWVAKLARWLDRFGFYPVTFKVSPEWHPQGFYILGGESSRGSHAVIARGLNIVHDPHPSRKGLVLREDATLLVPFDPKSTMILTDHGPCKFASCAQCAPTREPEPEDAAPLRAA